jgi:transketolase
MADIHMRDAFIQTLYGRAQSDANIIFLSADYGAPSLDQFRADLPKQFVNTGISEQNQISVAAGLALGGKRSYVYSIASFITTRCYEQIKIDLCCMNLPVTIIGVGACYAYGVDGPTHHATEDIALMRVLPNMDIYSPSDANMAAALVDVTLRSSTPIYCRFDRGKYPLLYSSNEDLSRGVKVIQEGNDISIITTGIMVHRALEVADELRNYSVSTQIIDVYRLKPLNAHDIVNHITNTDKILTLEEHTIHGGLGSIIAEMLADFDATRSFKRLAIVDDLLYAYGTRRDLHLERGLDKESIVKTILDWK